MKAEKLKPQKHNFGNYKTGFWGEKNLTYFIVPA